MKLAEVGRGGGGGEKAMALIKFFENLSINYLFLLTSLPSSVSNQRLCYVMLLFAAKL